MHVEVSADQKIYKKAGTRSKWSNRCGRYTIF